MAFFTCFSTLIGRKKKDKGDGHSPSKAMCNNGLGTVQKQLDHPVKSPDECLFGGSTSVSVPEPFKKSNFQVVGVGLSTECPVETEAMAAAYSEGEDKYDEKSTRRGGSNIPAVSPEADETKSSMQKFEFERMEMETNPCNSLAKEVDQRFEIKTGKDVDSALDMIESGHLSDPGMAREEHWASPKLKRSCSSLDTREVVEKIANQFPSSKSQSFEELQKLAEEAREEDVYKGSPSSADKVMLKKRSSRQILPSRSRRLWWKLFLWSHRNLQKPWPARTTPFPLASRNQLGGYSSDTLEPSRAKELIRSESPLSFSVKLKPGDESDGFQAGASGFWPQNEWVAFSMQSSPLKRVEDWVNDLEIQSSSPADEEFGDDDGIAFPPSPGPGKSRLEEARTMTPITQEAKLNSPEALFYANSVVQSLNSSSTVAHISGMGLRVLPTISHFWRLRSVNLSNNNIAHLTPDSLPKGLHILDLSRNKISTIEGLRELTRLRVLNLSYNRITRIGHGLSNCQLLKELYLAGNKIGEAEGLHRLLKLTLLDLSFNKITTTKSLGQLVANYQSLVALNLLGNPIHSTLSDDQLRKAVCGLLPKLAYLNKQPINQQKAREVGVDIVAKASSSARNDLSRRRKAVKRTGQGGGGSLPLSSMRSNTNAVQSSRNKLKNQNHRRPVLKTSAMASSSSR
ncbi:hypothetical protein Dimus_006109 [Dionaea muscipula]